MVCKPINLNLKEIQKPFKIGQPAKVQKGNLIIDNYRENMKLGAFEVQLYSKISDVREENVFLHSKIKDGTWPNIEDILTSSSKYIIEEKTFHVEN